MTVSRCILYNEQNKSLHHAGGSKEEPMRLNIYPTKLNPTIYSLPGEKLLEAYRTGAVTENHKS